MNTRPNAGHRGVRAQRFLNTPHDGIIIEYSPFCFHSASASTALATEKKVRNGIECNAMQYLFRARARGGAEGAGEA